MTGAVVALCFTIFLSAGLFAIVVDVGLARIAAELNLANKRSEPWLSVSDAKSLRAADLERRVAALDKGAPTIDPTRYTRR